MDINEIAEKIPMGIDIEGHRFTLSIWKRTHNHGQTYSWEAIYSSYLANAEWRTEKDTLKETLQSAYQFAMNPNKDELTDKHGDKIQWI